MMKFGPDAGGDDTAMTRAGSGNGSALFTFLHRAPVDICCLRVCGNYCINHC